MPNTPPPDPQQPIDNPEDLSRPASSSPTEPQLQRETPGGAESSGHDAYSALRLPEFRLFMTGRTLHSVGSQMANVALSWQVYQATHSATALGLVGLVQALPVIVLALPAGHNADVRDRKNIVLVTQAILALLSLLLAVVSWQGLGVPNFAPLAYTNQMLGLIAASLGEEKARFDDPVVPVILLLLLLSGAASAYLGPARSAIVPQIVPKSVLSNAVTWNSSMFQMSSMLGPALGGLMLWMLDGKAYVYTAVYTVEALAALSVLPTLWPIHVRPVERAPRGRSLESLAAGVSFVWRTKIILATITLDLFAVLLGGAVALLPMFADQVLHVGPAGLGWLRAAPAIGALCMGLLLAHRPPKNAGAAMLWSVAGFGAATIVFGLSENFALSFVMLLLTGALDNISVVIRHTLVQLLTPDSMRGRVSAVNSVFIGASNELGALESGLTAALWGPVAAVVVGGSGTILVVIAAALIWPELRKFGKLNDV